MKNSTPKTFQDFGLQVSLDSPALASWSNCPTCGSGGPEHASVELHLGDGTFVCHNCGWNGQTGVGDSKAHPWLFKDPLIPSARVLPLPKSTLTWFSRRGISEETVSNHHIGVAHVWNHVHQAVMEAIVFPVVRDTLLVNHRYRFSQRGGIQFATGAEVSPFGLDDISPTCTHVVSNEIELLSLKEIGINHVIALPFEIPTLPQTKKHAAERMALIHQSLSFLETVEARLAPVQKFVLCLGNSQSAKAVEEELARRLGQERCWTLPWTDGATTLSAMLAADRNSLSALVYGARPLPVKGVFTIDDVQGVFDELYLRGLPPGPPTGWESLDPFYRPALGQWTLVTGIPSHGKSNWIDALMINLAEQQGWKFCIFSPENQPVARHFANLAEKYIGYAFNPKNNDLKMTPEQKAQSVEWMRDRFSVILPDPEDSSWGIDSILALAKSVVLRKGIQGLVIDPWNELDHTRHNHLSETEHVSLVISKIRQFARAHRVHVWLVAHPTKMQKREDGTYPVPMPYDVSGSANFLNKADFCISIYRFVGQADQTITEVYVQKVRFKENGGVGRASLRYIPSVGRFVDDIDQSLRTMALDKKLSKPTEDFILSHKMHGVQFVQPGKDAQAFAPSLTSTQFYQPTPEDPPVVF